MKIRWGLMCVFVLISALAVAQTRPGTQKAGSRPSTGKSTTGKTTTGKNLEKVTAVKEFDGFSFEPPEEWRALVVPHSGMRLARYALPSPSETVKNGELIVYHFRGGAGGADANIARWKSQFEKPEGLKDSEFSAVHKQTVDGLKVTILEIQGTYTGMQASGQMGKPQKGQMMLAAVVETKSSIYYVRTLGPVKTLAHWKQRWFQMMLKIKATKKSE